MNQSVYDCNLCGKHRILPLIDFGEQPIAKHYLRTPSQASRKWPVKLYFCESCGLTQLKDSCPPEYLYDNYITLSSWKAQPHAQHEIEMIKKLPGIEKKSKIIEIGSNDGVFLDDLAKNGFNNTLGIEPAKDAFDISVGRGVNTRKEFLNNETAKNILEEFGIFDLFISRQNLEHMSDLTQVAKSIKDLVRVGGYVLIEVPNFNCNLIYKDYSLWEEHVNYFTIDTLSYFFALSNVELIHSEIIKFSGEGIIAVGRRVETIQPSTEYVPTLRSKNIEYSAFWPTFNDSIVDFLSKQKKLGKRIAVYGAGARAFCLINFLKIACYIDLIVEDQPEKQNLYMPGGHLPIVGSEALILQKIDICLLGVNTENEDKVSGKHTRWVAEGGVFWSILPPSEILLPVW